MKFRILNFFFWVVWKFDDDGLTIRRNVLCVCFDRATAYRIASRLVYGGMDEDEYILFVSHRGDYRKVK